MNRPTYFLLVGHEAVPCTVLAWAQWFERRENIHVARIELDVGPHKVEVSTVFLGLDHSYGDGPPLLFETMVFDPPEEMELFGRKRMVRPESEVLEHSQWRYSTWEEAEYGHVAVVDAILEAAARSQAAAQTVIEGLAR